MRSVHLFKMRLWVYLIEIPLMFLLMVCWNMNDKVEGLLKLYPLMIALAAFIVFLAVYFFRVVEISWEEIRDIGLFSAKDDAVINKGKKLSIKLLSRGRIKLELIGHDGEYAGFDWMKPEDGEPSDIALYRGNAYGGKGALRKILTYFGADAEDASAILNGGKFAKNYEYSSVTSEKFEEYLEVTITINETLARTGVPIRKK